MWYLIFALAVLLASPTPARAQIGVDIGIGGVNIGINMPAYPQLVAIPGYPVYYDPRVNANYFFYDGLFWVFAGGNWYDSTWYDGPWELVEPLYVPQFLLVVPVRYYRSPPVFFRGWARDEPPQWGGHWGRDWQHRREGWDRWDRHSVPAAAPLPVYQRQYSGNRYPHSVEQQHSIRSRSYHFQPHDAVAQQRFQQQGAPSQAHRSAGNNAGKATAPSPRAQAHQPAPQESSRTAAQQRAEVTRHRQESPKEQREHAKPNQQAVHERMREQPAAQAQHKPERNAGERGSPRATAAAEEKATAAARQSRAAAQASERGRSAQARPEPRPQPQARAAEDRQHAQAAQEREHAQAAQEQQHQARESRAESQGRRPDRNAQDSKDKENRKEQ